MARAYSLDGERVVAAVRRVVCVGGRRYGQRRSVVKWSQRSARRQWRAEDGRSQALLVARERDWVLARMREADLTLRALLGAGTRPGGSYYALWHFLQHEGVTFKKSLRASNRTGRISPGGVRKWKARRRRSTQATCLHRRDLGENQHDAHMADAQRRTPHRKAPSGDGGPHVSGGAALRRAHAPAYRRTINGASFRAYVEQVLAPSSRRRIVVMDNLGSTRAALFARDPRGKAKLFFLQPTRRPQSNRAGLRKMKTCCARERTIEQTGNIGRC